MDWEIAKSYLDTCIKEYSLIGRSGLMCLTLTLWPVLERYEAGERTQELFDDIMEVAL